MTARQALDRVGVQQAEVSGEARTVTAVGSLCVILTLHLSTSLQKPRPLEKIRGTVTEVKEKGFVQN